MQSKRPRFIGSASCCLMVALLSPGLAGAVEPPATGQAKAAPAATAKGASPAAAPAKPGPAPAPATAANPAASPAPAPGKPAPTPTPAIGQNAGSAAATPSPEVMLEAKQRFDRGFELYEEGEYPLALIEFNRAYELVPNYRVLYNIGQVCIQLGQYANARRTLEEYLAKGGDGLAADRRAAVDKDLEMLRHRTAFLTISSNVENAEVLVDDVSVGKTPLGPALLVDAGVHRATCRARAT